MIQDCMVTVAFIALQVYGCEKSGANRSETKKNVVQYSKWSNNLDESKTYQSLHGLSDGVKCKKTTAGVC